MQKSSRRPIKPLHRTSSKDESSKTLPKINLHVTQMAIQKEINVLLNVNDNSDNTIQTNIRIPSPPSSSGRKMLRKSTASTTERSSSPWISITLPSPTRYTPRTETRQAIKTFHQLYMDDPPTPRPSAKTMELELEEEEAQNADPATCVDEKVINTIVDMMADKQGQPIHIPKTPRYNGWSIKDVQNNYGWGGKMRFMAQVRKNKHNDEDEDEIQPRHATTTSKADSAEMDQMNTDNMQCTKKYINTCLKMELTPEPFIIPKREACAIDLSFYGTGNKPMNALSTCLDSIPKLQTLVVKENRLTDAAIVNILQSSDFSRLLTLNLSKNRLREKGTKAMATFLNHNRVVQTLILCDCDLHSDFIKIMEDPLSKNPSLTMLDLSKNKFDDLCAESLQGICKDNSNLLSFDLSWNSLRYKSAIGLAAALEQNQSLQNLNLGWNGIGHGQGASQIARALRNNTSLQTLDLTANSIAPDAALALANVWAESTVLEILVLDQNPIGRDGMRAIFRAYSNPTTKTHGRTIQFQACTLHETNETLFDPNQSSGRYEIDLGDPCKFWKALEVLRLVNLYPSACTLTNVLLTTSLESKALHFHRVDIQQQLNTLRCNSSEERNRPNEDDDDDGVPVISALALAHQDEPWRVPLQGVLSFDFQYLSTSPPPPTTKGDIEPDVVSVFWQIYSTLEFDSDRIKYIRMFLHDHFVHAYQARHFLTTVTSIETSLVQLLLEKVMDAENLVSITATPSLPMKHQSLLNEYAGKLVFFDSNLPNGHYSLDLSTSMDQRILSRLIKLSGDDKLVNKQQGGINTSQKGNWECFRNETIDGHAFGYVKPSGFPCKGLLEFDFVLTSRLPRGTPSITKEQLELLCSNATPCTPSPPEPTKPDTKGPSRAKPTKEAPKQTQRAKSTTQQQIQQDYEARRAELKRTFSFGEIGISTAQLLVLADCYKDLEHGRVDCVVSLLNSVLDLEELLISVRNQWTPTEVASLVSRVGWLNIWNPAYAEMEYTLNLSIYEERQMAIMLAQLGDLEPGENWVDETYNNIFGWELPLSWVQGKVPHVGQLFLRYTTGPTFKYRVASVREEMKKQTLCGKHHMKKEMASAPPPPTPKTSRKASLMLTSSVQSPRRKSIHQVTL